jgi:tRNA uridine 5-carboxymethylaminomethyl modification enzyme
MFTSRAEFRLSLRADNADQRLTPLGRDLGCVGDTRWVAFDGKMGRLSAGRAHLEGRTWTSAQAKSAGIHLSDDGQRRSGYQLLAFPDVDFDALCALDPEASCIDPETQAQLKREALYANYIERQNRDVDALKRDEAQAIPQDFDFTAMSGLSNELRQKLSCVRPATLAHAARIEGMTPAALTLLLARIRQHQRKSA